MKHNDVGKLGEDIASDFLKKNGFSIVERNIHFSHNEIDIIAKDKEFIIFVEVKTRSVGEDLYSPFGTPGAAVNSAKQKRTIAAAKDYLRANYRKCSKLQPRIDVIEVYLDKDTGKTLKINYIENAFFA